jgi:uncharacterized protein YecE (DUF72 family)
MNRKSPTPGPHLGTSGWTYADWQGRFYPKKLAKRQWFEFYCLHFDTVELNASFYRIPNVKAVAGWKQRSPDHFRFAVKISRLITHVKRLRACEHEIQWFFDAFAPLGEKIAIYLLQLPPSAGFDAVLLERFFQALPKGVRVAVEFRNRSWYRDETYRLLERNGHAFCIHDLEDLATERIIVGDTAYLRFHGAGTRYGGDYHDEQLAGWATWISKQVQLKVTVFGYFNNDIQGFAVRNCLRLKELVQG